MNSNHLTPEELNGFGFGSVGENVIIDRSVRFFGKPSKMTIGNNVRIDAFCIFSIGDQGITLKDYIHFGAGCYLYGTGGKITIHEYATLSSRVSLYTVSDDFVDGHLVNPMIDDTFRKLHQGDIELEKHAIVGASSVILPGVKLHFGASVGALTLVRKSVAEGQIVQGSPAQILPKTRNLEKLRTLENAFVSQLNGTFQ